ncbi:MAG: lysophospholipid acyltransferase family protein [Planctomycetota bacterium]
MADHLPLAHRYPGMPTFRRERYRFYTLLLRNFYRLFYKAKVHNLERVPSAGPLLMIANHQTHFDPPFVGCWLPRGMWFLARESLFGPFGLGSFLKSVNAIPLKRGESDTVAIRKALDVLSRGGGVVMFPEGTRSPDGDVQEFQRGISLLLKRAKCPVLPVGISGLHDAWPRGKASPNLFSGARFHVNYGYSIHPEELLKDGPESALRKLREQVIALKQEVEQGGV